MAAATPGPDRPILDSRQSPRTLRSDLELLRSRLVAAVDARPLTAAAAAAGIGFVLGGGLTRPAIGILIEAGSRVAANWLGGATRPPEPANFDAEAEENRE